MHHCVTEADHCVAERDRVAEPDWADAASREGDSFCHPVPVLHRGVDEQQCHRVDEQQSRRGGPQRCRRGLSVLMYRIADTKKPHTPFDVWGLWMWSAVMRPWRARLPMPVPALAVPDQ